MHIHGGAGMMPVRIRRKTSPAGGPAEQLLEIVTPRTNAALISPAENLCAALATTGLSQGRGPVSLEIVADGERKRFFVRTRTVAEQEHLRGQVGAAYPQAGLRSLDPTALTTGDPARLGPNEQVGAC